MSKHLSTPVAGQLTEGPWAKYVRFARAEAAEERSRRAGRNVSNPGTALTPEQRSLRTWRKGVLAGIEKRRNPRAAALATWKESVLADLARPRNGSK